MKKTSKTNNANVAKKAPTPSSTAEKEHFVLEKKNWIMVGIAVACIILGFILMTGAPSGEKFNPDIFSVRRIHIGPMLSLFGFLFMIVAIMWRPKKAGEA